MSQAVCRPSVNPRTAGATPNEITSERESRSAPSVDWCLESIRATTPSRTSKTNASGSSKKAIQSNRAVSEAM